MTQRTLRPKKQPGSITEIRLATQPVHTAQATDATDAPWWRDAVIYQIYPRSWADSNGDGIGDLPGITGHLDHLRDLGVDAIWLSPFFTSPQADAGYDVADYRSVDPLFGQLTDADALIGRAHDLGLKVIVDLVPNHSSDEHAWFQAALAAGPGSPERDRYLFRDGTGPDGATPPNNWESVFGGPGWTRVIEADGRPGQWYLHLFDVKQPDFNWEHPQVRAEFESVLRFWLDRGVDGFRVDVAHGLIKVAGLPDHTARTTMLGATEEAAAHLLDETPPEPTHLTPYWDQDGVHEIYRQWRAVLDSYGTPDRILCAEAWVEPMERAVLYTRPDEMHQAFNFDFLSAPWHAAELRAVITRSLAAADSVGAPSTWVLSNHDVVRHATRLGYPVGTKRPNGIGASDDQPDEALGLRRARAGARSPGLDATARRGPPGPDLPPDRRRGAGSGRLSGADALGQGRARLRLRPGSIDVAATASGLRRPCGGPAGGGRGLDTRALSHPLGHPARPRSRDRVAHARRGVCR